MSATHKSEILGNIKSTLYQHGARYVSARDTLWLIEEIERLQALVERAHVEMNNAMYGNRVDEAKDYNEGAAPEDRSAM